MEILILVLLYYLSQNPDFAESVKPIMCKLKDSEHMLSFLNDLSKFTQSLGNFQNNSKDAPNKTAGCEQKETQNKKSPQSPTVGIADEFIQQILESYLNKKG